MRVSRAEVAGLQLTITMVRGAICTMAASASALQPLRGGSTTTTSGRRPSAAKRAAAAPASMQENSALPSGRPSRAAVLRASSTAWGTTSTPTSLPQSACIESPMLPMPQYRSSRKSPGRSPASSRALAYSASAAGVFTW